MQVKPYEVKRAESRKLALKYTLPTTHNYVLELHEVKKVIDKCNAWDELMESLMDDSVMSPEFNRMTKLNLQIVGSEQISEDEWEWEFVINGKLYGVIGFFEDGMWNLNMNNMEKFYEKN